MKSVFFVFKRIFGKYVISHKKNTDMRTKGESLSVQQNNCNAIESCHCKDIAID
jgi:hypothetical protein